MRKALLFVMLMSCVACDDVHLIDDDAARLRGDYPVQRYVINGDTLFEAGKIDKIKVEDFKVMVSRRSADSLDIGFSWVKGGEQKGIYLRRARLTPGNAGFHLSIHTIPPYFYKGTINSNIYTEQSSLAGLGFVLLPENYPLEELPDSTGGTVTITATRLP